MKTSIKQTALALSALALFVFGARAAGFTKFLDFTNNTGGDPYPALFFGSNAIYGTCILGGSGGSGTIYKINPDGSGYTNIYNFSATIYTGDANTNTDGELPRRLSLSSNIFFGSTQEGGENGTGALFRINPDGSHYTNFYNFPPHVAGSNGYFAGDVFYYGNALYGITSQGGTNGKGTLFKINFDGTGLTNLLAFSADGLVFSGNSVFGTTSSEPGVTNGAIFKIGTDGTGFTNIYIFSPLASAGIGLVSTNSDGATPGQLLLSGDTLFGTASRGGTGGSGAIFKLNTNGSDFTTLHDFSAVTNNSNLAPEETNPDGSGPNCLILSGNVLYGATGYGGPTGIGTLFRIGTDGTGFTMLYAMSPVTWITNVVGATTYISFTNANGQSPAGLVISSNTLYGTARSGGGQQVGTFFSLTAPTAPVPLKLQLMGGQMVFTWDNAAAFTLQSAPTPAGVYSNAPGACSPYTNKMTGAPVFFRLRANQ